MKPSILVRVLLVVTLALVLLGCAALKAAESAATAACPVAFAAADPSLGNPVCTSLDEVVAVVDALEAAATPSPAPSSGPSGAARRPFTVPFAPAEKNAVYLALVKRGAVSR